MARMSASLSIGFVGVSSQTNFVSGRAALSTASGSVRSTKSKLRPPRVQIWSKSRKVPPYTSSPQMTWSPWRSVCMIVDVAAQPLAKAMPWVAPSSAAAQSCSAVRVGFPVRLYS